MYGIIAYPKVMYFYMLYDELKTRREFWAKETHNHTLPGKVLEESVIHFDEMSNLNKSEFLEFCVTHKLLKRKKFLPIFLYFLKTEYDEFLLRQEEKL